MKVLVTRTDGLENLVLSMPVFKHLRAASPELKIHALVAPDAVPLVENDPSLAGIWTWSDADSRASLAALEIQLRTEGFDAVIMLHYEQKLARFLKRVGIRHRRGYWSGPISRFLLNKGSRFPRSGSQAHEMERNLRLAEIFLGGKGSNFDLPVPEVFLTEGQRVLGREFCAEFGVGSDQVVFLHPGSGEAGPDWSPVRFTGVANALGKSAGFRVFVIGAAGDEAGVSKTSTGLDSHVTVLKDRYDWRVFLGILSAGDFFVGPTPGFLHMAAALGLGTVGLYPPLVDLCVGRRAAMGEFHTTVTPKVDCPESLRCSRERCEHFNCMDGIFERDVLGAVMDVHRRKTVAALEQEAAREEES